jgi:hypothetical protein
MSAPIYEVVWDDTERNGRQRYLNTIAPAPREPRPEPRPDAHAFLRALKESKKKADRLKFDVYTLFLLRDMAIGDVVAALNGKFGQASIYGAVKRLRLEGHLRVVGRERRERINGAVMQRDIYGPTIGRHQS